MPAASRIDTASVISIRDKVIASIIFWIVTAVVTATVYYLKIVSETPPTLLYWTTGVLQYNVTRPNRSPESSFAVATCVVHVMNVGKHTATNVDIALTRQPQGYSVTPHLPGAPLDEISRTTSATDGAWIYRVYNMTSGDEIELTAATLDSLGSVGIEYVRCEGAHGEPLASRDRFYRRSANIWALVGAGAIGWVIAGLLSMWLSLRTDVLLRRSASRQALVDESKEP